jgi:hypothetical protein
LEAKINAKEKNTSIINSFDNFVYGSFCSLFTGWIKVWFWLNIPAYLSNEGDAGPGGYLKFFK